MRKSYTSDITREQFEQIKPTLEGLKKKTRPRKLDLYDVFCGILYILRTGSQWRNLPHDFPKWQAVYFYYQIWNKVNEEGISPLAEILKKISTENTNSE